MSLLSPCAHFVEDQHTEKNRHDSVGRTPIAKDSV